MKYSILLLIITFSCYKGIAQSTETIDLNKSLLCANAWVIDEFYIDSVLTDNSHLNSLIFRFYPNGDYMRAPNDFLLKGMYWELSMNNIINITYPEKNYVERSNIIVLMPEVLVTNQTVIGVQDKNIHLIECRYKPYIKNQ